MKQPGMQRQRGAVTLIGAMFLIFVMVVLLATAQRMAASSITDTAQQGDSVEALFVAESGLERAAWRYSSGSTCAALAGETASVARGSFSILTAAMNGSLCKVRISGTVISTSAGNAAVHTIEAELTAPAGTGWAVGNNDYGHALILQWNGSNWQNNGPYSGLLNSALNSVHCASSSDCWAMGDTTWGSSEFIAHWNGTTWSEAGPYSNIPNTNLNSVYCISSSDCWAVGDNSGGWWSSGELIMHWNGSTWTRYGPSGSIPNVNLNSVHCVNNHDCWAVGNDLNSGWNREVMIHWNGSNWSRFGPYASIPSADLNSVHCVASNDCWAVGDSSGGELIIHWNGSSWSRSGPYSGIPDENLLGVSCVAASNCWAVGNSNGGELIIHWDGSNWSRSGPWGSIANQDLHAIFMVSANKGYAVGANGAAAIWNGSNWSGVSTPTSQDLNAIYMDGSGGGSGGVTLAHWTEVIQ
jgi:Tfp pilus assembly protein PilX